MHPKQFAFIGGIVMLALGVLAFIPTFNYFFTSNGTGLMPLNLDTSYAYFLGIFPMNVVNKIALIFFGVSGIAAANAPTTNLPKSIWFARIVFLVMAPLAILGLIPTTDTLRGYLPLYGATVWEHAAFALLGAYFGYALSTTAKRINDRNEKTTIKARPIGV